MPPRFPKYHRTLVLQDISPLSPSYQLKELVTEQIHAWFNFYVIHTTTVSCNEEKDLKFFLHPPSNEFCRSLKLSSWAYTQPHSLLDFFSRVNIVFSIKTLDGVNMTMARVDKNFEMISILCFKSYDYFFVCRKKTQTNSLVFCYASIKSLMMIKMSLLCTTIYMFK